MEIFEIDRIKKFTSLIEKYKDDNDALFKLYIKRGISYMSIMDKQSSFNDFQMALKINNKRWEIYYYLGKFYSAFDDEYEKAIENFKKSISINPRPYLNYYSIANIYMLSEKYDIAIEYYTCVIKRNKKHYLSYCKRGLCYSKKTTYDKAIEDINKAIEIKPYYSYPHYCKAVVLLKMGMTLKAAEEFTNSINLEHHRLNPDYGLGIARAYSDDFKGAIKELTKIIEVVEMEPLIELMDLEYAPPYYYTARGAIYTAYNFKAEGYIDFIEAEKMYRRTDYDNIFAREKYYLIPHILNFLYLEKFDEAEISLNRCLELKHIPSIWFIYKAALLWMREKDLNSTLKLIEEGLKNGYRFDYSIKTNLFHGYLFREIKTTDQFKKLLSKYHNQIL